jgi:hypothetical protein
MKRLIALAAILAAAASAAACSSAPSDVTVSGDVVVMGAGDCSSGQLPAEIQPDSTQVTVTSQSGTVLGSTYLGQPANDGSMLGQALCKLPFKVTSVPSARLYGIKVAGVSGTSWMHKPTGIVISVTEGL